MSLANNTYIVATIHDWNIAAFHKHSPNLPGEWHLIQHYKELSSDIVNRIGPRYIFFPHWSWKVPQDILSQTQCVCFHMTDVPYGRGGSPLQNLISRGHKNTVLTALQMVEEMDAGPVYLKENMDLSGRAQDIYERCAELTFEMIAKIVSDEPCPVAQEGNPIIFERRRPDQSQLPKIGNIETIYDHIRMLDADSYPHAYINYGQFRLKFSHAQHNGDLIQATVFITQRDGAEEGNDE